MRTRPVGTGRPSKLVLVTGTGTGVGKTWFAAATARALRNRGIAVAARKPVQSFEPGAGPTDAEELGAATGEDPEVVCHPAHSYPLALAPPMAAERLGRVVPAVVDLATELSWPADTTVGIVEAVGGPRSPLAADGDTVGLMTCLDPDLVVLVADAGLGVVNAVRLAVAALPGWPVVVALNRYDPADELHHDNRRWLTGPDGLDVITSPTELAARLARDP